MPRTTTRSWPVYGIQEGLFPEYKEAWRRKAACASTVASVCLFVGAVLLLSVILYPWGVRDSPLPTEMPARQLEELLIEGDEQVYIRDMTALIAMGMIFIGGCFLCVAYTMFYLAELRRLRKEKERREGIAWLRDAETVNLTTDSMTYGGFEEFTES